MTVLLSSFSQTKKKTMMALLSSSFSLQDHDIMTMSSVVIHCHFLVPTKLHKRGRRHDDDVVVIFFITKKMKK
jgi:hypothetical protein